ncbi:metal ABC transporter substrate-binding protein [Devriesea agamarum]|uniref:metal ABC transporter substrate-binding protein n=1 Tax=Devriesea agamarum TaxID=472569 RepID=UPI00071C551E|nr:metal ABC transporter substrate-binding protein [Devriesea agamarum]
MRLPKTILTLLMSLGLIISVSACSAGTSANQGKPVSIVASSYPLEYLASRIGGERAHVTNITPQGTDPHSVELSVNQVRGVADADLLLFIKGFQPPVDDAITSQSLTNGLDIAATVPMLPSSTGTDPHFWHDPLRMAQVGDATANKLATIDPDGAESYRSHAASLRKDLEALDASLTSQYSACHGDKAFITSHAAFNYLESRYGLKQVGITGVDPEFEPSPARLKEVADIAKKQHATTIFMEKTASPKVAESLASSLGVKTDTLFTMETKPESGDYLTAMRHNADVLTASWGCRS